MNTRVKVPIKLLALVLSFVLLVPSSQNARAQDCSALADLRIEDTNLLSATVVPASVDLEAAEPDNTSNNTPAEAAEEQATREPA